MQLARFGGGGGGGTLVPQVILKRSAMVHLAERGNRKLTSDDP